MEESYGCLTGTYARDKDAVVASMALCEAAAYYKTKNMTLWDAMIAMYERYGYYQDGITAITLKGHRGLGKDRTDHEYPACRGTKGDRCLSGDSRPRL